jgi:hypothetical protein
MFSFGAFKDKRYTEGGDYLECVQELKGMERKVRLQRPRGI